MQLTEEQKAFWMPRFKAKIAQITDRGCWNCSGYLTRGYGKIQVGHSKRGNKIAFSMHRLSWLLHKGEIPDSMFVCHHCDNPRCCNPEHLFIGTALDNSRDCVNKGRHLSGARHPMSKMTVEQIEQIREMRRAGAKFECLLALFPMAKSTLSYIINGKTYFR